MVEWLESQKWFSAILIVVYFGEWLALDLKVSSTTGILTTPLSYIPPADDRENAWWKYPLKPSMESHDWINMEAWHIFVSFLIVTVVMAGVILLLWWLFQVNTRNKGRLMIAVVALFWVIGHWFDWVLGFFAWGGAEFSRGIPGLMQLGSIGLTVLAFGLVVRLMGRSRRNATAPARRTTN